MKIFVLLLAISFTTSLWAQVFPVETILKNGDNDKMINLVFLSDGYQEDELDKFILTVNTVSAGMFSQSPFKEYKNYFNIYAIRVPSRQSGASHPKTTQDIDCAAVPITVVDNYFGSTFDFGGIHRLLAPTKNVGQVLAANFPDFDQAFVLVNSSYYGGSGGAYATSSANIASAEISFHEIGHSFAQLADEYWAGAVYAHECDNMTKESNKDKVKWKNWHGLNGVGIYPFTESPSWFRPHQNCKMRALSAPFCSVCTEAFVETIHSFVNPVKKYLPISSTISSGEAGVNFSLDLVKTIPNTLNIEWRKGTTVFATNTEVATLPLSEFTSDVTIIEAEVFDATSITRSDPHKSKHVYTANWKLTKTSSGLDVVALLIIGKETSPITSVEDPNLDVVSIYPNPFIDQLSISYSLTRNTAVNISILDNSGHVLKSILNDQEQKAGKHDYQFFASELNLSTGIYFFSLTIDGVQIVKKAIRK
jgi:hypothetical protein